MHTVNVDKYKAKIGNRNIIQIGDKFVLTKTIEYVQLLFLKY